MNTANSYVLPRQPGTTPPPDDAIPTDLQIGETWIEGQGKKRFDVFNPSNGETLTTVADGSVEDVGRGRVVRRPGRLQPEDRAATAQPESQHRAHRRRS